MIKPNPTIIMLTYDCDITTANPLFFTRKGQGRGNGRIIYVSHEIYRYLSLYSTNATYMHKI